MLAQTSCAQDCESPDDLGAVWTRAMADGDFAGAWAISDAVLARRDPSGRDDPSLPYHRRWVWDGRPFDGAAVLVRCYHGLGDTLQFCRYLAPLRRRVGALTLECQPELVALLADLAGPDRVVAFDPARPLPSSGCDLEIMELAHALRLRPEQARYEWRTRAPYRLAPARGVSGLCWRGSGWRGERNLPDRAACRLLAAPGARFVSLQRGATLPGLADDCPAAIAGTAARIAGCDLVVTVDTMVAHLAGLLGARTLLLLDSAPDWRWLAGGAGSPWYPTLQKTVQAQPGDWSGPLADAWGTLLAGSGCRPDVVA